MNAFEVATPGIDGGRQLGERVVHPAAHDEAQAVVDGTVRVRGRAPLAQAGAQAQLRGGRRTGARVVEREERGRAAERGRDRVLEEAVGRRVRGDARVGVDVDDAREDEHPGRVQDVACLRGEPAEVGLDGLDAAAAHGHVRPARAGRGHDRPASDQESSRVSHPPRIASARRPRGYRVAGLTSVTANVVRQRITISAGSSGTGSPFDTPLHDCGGLVVEVAGHDHVLPVGRLHARVQAGGVDVRVDRDVQELVVVDLREQVLRLRAGAGQPVRVDRPADVDAAGRLGLDEPGREASAPRSP